MMTDSSTVISERIITRSPLLRRGWRPAPPPEDDGGRADNERPYQGERHLAAVHFEEIHGALAVPQRQQTLTEVPDAATDRNGHRELQARHPRDACQDHEE